MRHNRKVALGVGLVAVAATVLAACSGSSGGGTGNNSKNTSKPPNTSAPNNAQNNSKTGYNAAANNIVRPSTKTGGTMNLLATGDCDSWDPAVTYYGWCWNMQRLFTRTLVGYSQVNGDKFKIAPDLATALGKHNADFTQWTYTLKSGLKFSTGKAITPNDIKYGIERLFATDVINGGPSSYFIDSIKHPKSYKGVYKSGPLSSIKTTSDSITFNLSSPNADFDYLMALPAAAPVPATVEGGSGFKGATYTKHPVASGPYMIQSYTPKQSITFVRNPNWSQSTDTIRHPLVDKVVLTVDTDPNDIDQKLQAGTADARADNTVQATFQSKILTQPKLKANADDPVSAFTRYMAVMPSVIPNVHCRQAIFYAFDKAGALRAYGGPTAGQVSGSFTPPGIPGYDPSFTPYPSGSGDSGNVAKAKDELKQCGKPGGFSTKLAYSTNSPQAVDLFKAEQSALGKVGIKVTPATADQSTYYSTFIGSPKNIKSTGIGIAIAGWGADYPTGYGFYNSITNGANILPTGNSNYASLNDPTVNKILDSAPAGKTTDADWQSLDKALMASATYLPVYWGKNLYYRNPRLTNVTSNNAQAFGIYDFVNAGVSG